MKFSKQLVLAGVISTGAILSATSSTAATIYQNSTSFASGGAGTDLDIAIRAEDFSLTGTDTTIRSIHWSGFIASQGTKTTPDDFTIQIYSDAGSPANTPASLLHTFNVGSSVTANSIGTVNFGGGRSADRFDYSANVATTTLTANTTYWLSIFNDTTGDNDDNWFWTTAAGTLTSPGSAYSLDTGTSWSQISDNMRFSLDDASVAAVPVPAAVWLMGSALAGLFGFSRKKQS